MLEPYLLDPYSPIEATHIPLCCNNVWRSLLLPTFLAHLKKNYGLITPPALKPNQTVAQCAHTDSSWITQVLCAPNLTVLFVHVYINLNAHLTTDDYFSSKYCLPLLGFTTPNWHILGTGNGLLLELLHQLNLISMQMQIFHENFLHDTSQNSQLWTMANWCSWTSSNTFTHSGNVVKRPANTTLTCLWLWTCFLKFHNNSINLWMFCWLKFHKLCELFLQKFPHVCDAFLQ